MGISIIIISLFILSIVALFFGLKRKNKFLTFGSILLLVVLLIVSILIMRAIETM